MGNLLNPKTGITHCDVNKDHVVDGKPASPFRRALCDLTGKLVPVSDDWRDVGNSKVTCEWCELRIEAAHAVARGDVDPQGLLSAEAVTIATAIFTEAIKRGVQHEMAIGEFATWIANVLYSDDDERYNWFLRRALDGETS